ncbi:bifunctional 3'-5' exonuclease/DNA polymerase [Nonomuraea phyllanthi]|uniref:DNA-directed DNA polymerase n=1 Tax=Nonomuraea phyllanthi TaxID=2219224 RepID=A0A5C4W8R8_9ACTN|nr:bifunctional 3'-5' exonuclease/DNA polymerase [Nonomuraea phyllanthi]KAB8192283.1 bifunctional 3'-5' exonuclease/DNA polymerase [Nonomuraea phyllanthi]QFY11362.1 bifunctional 3'-5' exonuclease/DNA polymerase [Nonomuraea phyllanthi]
MYVVVAGETVLPVGGSARRPADLAGAVRELEAAERPRWVWADAREVYPDLIGAGVRVSRCHDVALTEGLLLAYEGRYGESRSARAAHARLRGLPVPEEQPSAPGTLFAPEPLGAEAVAEVLDDQLRRIAALPEPGRFRLLAAAESAGALIAAEMSHDGMPWRRDAHDALLTELLGPRPVHGMRPARLQALADEVAAAFGHPVNPDSVQQLVKAFKAAGIGLKTTRSWELKQIDHPAVAPLLAYKELARLFSAHGWAWADQWVRGGRFRPEYVVGGVVSGRWATSGGGALQIPKVMRRVVMADEGWALIVADAAQLEPRVLAAMAGDVGLARAAGEIDLYAALAQSFGGERANAKIAMLSAMYGGTSGDAPKLLAVMRQRFPKAYQFVEDAAKAGEEGRLVRSWLGRTSPPPSSRWKELVSGPEGTRAARDRGRFTRNFVVQGTAAEWALALMAVLRGLLPEPARLVFFQHDEVMVHCPLAQAEEVIAAVSSAASEATRLLFGQTPVRIPMEAVAVSSYADAK